MSLLFNILSRLVIAFLPRSKPLLISCLQCLSAMILEPKEIKFATVTFFSLNYLQWSGGTRCHDLSFLNVEFYISFFSLSSFTFIERLFSFSSLSAIRVVLSAYLRLLIFLIAILIPACYSSRQALMVYSAYKLNKQGDNTLTYSLSQFWTSLLFHIQY